MKFLLVLATFFLIFLSTSNINCFSEKLSENAGFEAFIRLAIQNYSNWLQANNLDPTSPIPNPPEFELNSDSPTFNLSCYLRDEQMKGHSNPNNEHLIDFIDADLSNQYIELDLYHIGNITFEGNYTGNGTLVTGEALRGQGKFNLFAYNIILNEEMRYSFDITPEGFIDISSSGPISYYLRTRKDWNTRLDTYFEDLWDNGAAGDYADDVKEKLQEEYEKRIESWYGEGRDALIHKYFVELFEETPIDEIVGTTMPPIYTTTAQPPPECPPCLCECTSNEYIYSIKK